MQAESNLNHCIVIIAIINTAWLLYSALQAHIMYYQFTLYNLYVG